LDRPVNIACDSESSSIESCVNAIWSDLQETSALDRSLVETPGNQASRIALLRETKAALPAEIRLLGAADDYHYMNRNPSCTATWDGIDWCESALRTARHGLELLTRRELVAALSPATRDRLKRRLREGQAQYTGLLDLIVASGQGDPSELCNVTYASVASCEQAVAANSKAIREQIFPDYMCGQVVRGRFVTAQDAAAEARRDVAGPAPGIVLPRGFTFDEAVRFYGERLQQERQLLEKAKRGR
jgi:hypothetical protein